MGGVRLDLQQGTWFRFEEAGLSSELEGPYRIQKSWDAKEHLVPSEHSNKIHILVDTEGKKFTYTLSDAAGDSIKSIYASAHKEFRSYPLSKRYRVEVLSTNEAEASNASLKKAIRFTCNR